jgi:hypothetical protein
MAPRKDPASVVVDFFSTAPIETAATVLAICKGIVAKRQPAKSRRAKPVQEVELKAVGQ